MPMTVYLDIAKAFDTINYKIILVKLCRMGFDSAFLRFFGSYLTDRQQRFVISCGKSDFRPITSGGPQGSIFAVFLFSVYINDLPEIIVNECFLYADDTKIVSTVDNKMQLEKDIESAIVWSKENRLNFNFDKFKNVKFSLRKNQNKQILRLPSHRDIPQEIHFKDLGIYFSENLSWDYHLSFVLRKANQKLAYLKRSIPSETKLSVKCNLVKTYIISILFYGSNLWFASKTIVRQMERLQRKSLKWIQSNSHFTDKEYNDCVRSVNLLPITYQIVFFLDLVVLNRILTRKLASSLDIFLSNNANLCSEILEEKSFSDHKYLLAEISIEYAEQEPLPKMKRLNIGKANWNEFTINFNFPMSSFDSVDNIVDSFYHKLEVASSIAIPLKTSRRTNAPFYMSSNSIHLENKLRTALKNAQNSEKISRLREELSISLNNDKKNFVEKSRVWSTNDAYKLMRPITKQPALPEKMVYMEKEVFGYKSFADCFNNYFASVFVQDDTEVVIPFNQSPEIFLDDIQFSKAAMSEEVKNIRSGANSSDGISPKFLNSALP